MTVGIIGAGAAGLMAAATLLEHRPDARVVVFEKNDGIGKKVLISGGGRCNVTTGIQDVRTVLTYYPRGGKFLAKAMHRFPPAQVYAWFEAHGVPLKIEEDLRVFPVSNDGHDVVGVFTRIFRTHQVDVRLKQSVEGVERDGDRFRIRLKNNPTPVLVDAVILTTGGQAYRHTGSTGDGYAFAQSLGHGLTPLAPSLNAFFTKESWPKEVAGVSFARVTIQAPDAPTAPAHTGPILFTHKGVTGPAVFALSGKVAFVLYDATHPLRLVINLFPDQTAEDLVRLFRTEVADAPKRSILTLLAHHVPRSFAELACRETHIASDHRVADVSLHMWRAIASWLTAVPLQAIQRGAGDEFVTAGGIPTTEVNPSTMESRLCPNLFFAGEILDVDGFTGGFNLQASWATGFLAGTTLAERT